MQFYTYCYLDENDIPYYIGKGTGGRINAPHECGLPAPEKRIFLKRDLTEEQAFGHEVYLIDVIGRKDLGTGPLVNRTRGGHGTSGWVMGEETKQKIAEAKTGKPREDMMGDRNPMRDQETAEKNAEAKRGRECSEETRQKISKTLTGRKDTPETRRKKSEASKGKSKSKEHRRSISEAKSGERHPAYGKTGANSWNFGRKFYVNREGEVRFLRENPGEGWQLGRKWKSTEG